MAAKLNQNYRLVLEAIAEYRVLTVNQLATVVSCNRQVGRRYLKALEEAGLVQLSLRGIGRGRGRPERVASLTDQGVDLLRSEGVFTWEVPHHHVTAETLRNLEHQILLNWFRVHLVHVEKHMPKSWIRFLASTSPFLRRDSKERSMIFDSAPIAGGSDEMVGFTPDGVWSLTDRECGQTVLFFLEVDMGTESIISPQHNMQDIQQKVLNYSSYFDSNRYKRYEQTWGCELKGFRLLFLTHTITRLTALCNLAREMPETDFVWLTEQSRLFELGVSGDIWARGGHVDIPCESVFGSLLCSMPIPV